MAAKPKKITTRQAAYILAHAPHTPPEFMAKQLGMTLKQYGAFVERRTREAWAWAEAQAQGQFVADSEAACARLDTMTGQLLEAVMAKSYTMPDPKNPGELKEIPLNPMQLAGLSKSIADLQAARIQLSGSSAFKALERARTRYLADRASDTARVSAYPGSPPIKLSAAATTATTTEPPSPPPPPPPSKKKRRGRRRGRRAGQRQQQQQHAKNKKKEPTPQ